MKQSLSLLLILGVSILFFGCSENSLVPAADNSVQGEQEAFFKGAKKPAAKLVGDLNCLFTGPPPTFWNGTIDFEGVDKFGITFISLGAPRDYSQASPFNEEWVIYYENTDYNNPANVVMRGWSQGVVTYANKIPEPVNFLENGKVTEAYGPLEAWKGCSWHVKGLVHFEEPMRATGKARIN